MTNNQGGNKTFLLMILIFMILLIGWLVYTYMLRTIPSEVPEESLDPPQVPNQSSELLEVINPRNESIELLRKNFTEKFKVLDEEHSLALKYLEDMEEVWMKNFTLNKAPHLGKIASFGITLLSGYANDNKLDKYLSVVEDLIKRVDAELKKTTFGKKTTPWNQEWYDVSVLLTRMLATYEFLGDDNDIKRICHLRICKITPQLDNSLGWRREGIELVWIAVPRLITNYIYNFDNYNAEAREISSKLSADMMTSTSFHNVGYHCRIYPDGSNIYNKVATYWPLVTSGEFYSSVLRALELETGIEDKTKEIFNAIMHPEMDFVPYGAFGRNAEVKCTQYLAENWPSYNKRNADLKVHVSPVSGLGVFKSEKFAFWVRVQRKGLAAYVSDQTHFNLAAGWIQMRKLYLTDVKYDYDDGMDWPKLKTQPGVISYADGDDFDTLKPEPGKIYKNHDATNIESHIGHFEDENGRVLYWTNKYKFNLYGETKITEFGICTDNGLVMRHKIKNLSEKNLKFQHTDDDIDNNLYVRIWQDPPAPSKRAALIEKGSRVVIFTQRVFNDKIYPKSVERAPATKNMKFEFGSDTYEIAAFTDYHILKKNSKPILAGSWKDFQTETITHNHDGKELKFKLDKTTRMFIPE